MQVFHTAGDAAQQRQHLLGEQRLQQEQQAAADKERHREQDGQQEVGSAGLRWQWPGGAVHRSPQVARTDQRGNGRPVQ